MVHKDDGLLFSFKKPDSCYICYKMSLADTMLSDNKAVPQKTNIWFFFYDLPRAVSLKRQNDDCGWSQEGDGESTFMGSKVQRKKMKKFARLQKSWGCP